MLKKEKKNIIQNFVSKSDYVSLKTEIERSFLQNPNNDIIFCLFSNLTKHLGQFKSIKDFELEIESLRVSSVHKTFAEILINNEDFDFRKLHSILISRILNGFALTSKNVEVLLSIVGPLSSNSSYKKLFSVLLKYGPIDINYLTNLGMYWNIEENFSVSDFDFYVNDSQFYQGIGSRYYSTINNLLLRPTIELSEKELDCIQQLASSFRVHLLYSVLNNIHVQRFLLCLSYHLKHEWPLKYFNRLPEFGYVMTKVCPEEENKWIRHSFDTATTIKGYLHWKKRLNRISEED